MKNEIEIKKEYYEYPEGHKSLKSTITYKNGVLHGLWTTYYRVRPQVAFMECTFVNGLEQGIRREFRSNGDLWHATEVMDNMQHGVCRFYECQSSVRSPRIMRYYLYDKAVTKDEYEEHKLIKELSGI